MSSSFKETAPKIWLPSKSHKSHFYFQTPGWYRNSWWWWWFCETIKKWMQVLTSSLLIKKGKRLPWLSEISSRVGWWSFWLYIDSNEVCYSYWPGILRKQLDLICLQLEPQLKLPNEMNSSRFTFPVTEGSNDPLRSWHLVIMHYLVPF